MIYAASNGTAASTRASLTAAHKLTSNELRKAARLLKKNKAPQFMRAGKGYYIAIVSPDTVYDLQSDALWQDVSKYQDCEQIFSGEIGRLFGVIVVARLRAAGLERRQRSSRIGRRRDSAAHLQRRTRAGH